MNEAHFDTLDDTLDEVRLPRVLRTHIMLDIETMGTTPGSAILSIGATRFDPRAADKGVERFHVGIDLESSQSWGFTFGASTVQWWLHDDRAAARTAMANLEKVDVTTALEGFGLWVRQDPLEGIWGNAASFDCGLLRAAYEKIGMDVPWRFWQERCYRTLKGIANVPIPPAEEGVAHDALFDATRQAAHLCTIYNALGLDT
jgi:3' exoribonuclease, RNase T-like